MYVPVVEKGKSVLSTNSVIIDTKRLEKSLLLNYAYKIYLENNVNIKKKSKLSLFSSKQQPYLTL